MKVRSVACLASFVFLAAGLFLQAASSGSSHPAPLSNHLAGAANRQVSPHAAVLKSITVTALCDCFGQKTPHVTVGATIQLIAMGTYSDGSTQYLTDMVTWASLRTSVVTIDQTGLATGLAVGTARTEATQGKIKGTYDLPVKANELLGVILTPSEISLAVGATQQFNATGVYLGDLTQDLTSTVAWTSSVPTVATVTSAGTVRAVAPGTTTIEAVSGITSGTTMLTVTSGPPPNLGAWSQPYNMGVVAINAALLNTGKVLMWDYPGGRNGGPSRVALLDPVANTTQRGNFPFDEDIFCAAQSLQPDGTLLLAGGTDDALNPLPAGINNTTFFDPATETWSQGTVMNNPRWYPSTIELASGKTLAVSGVDASGAIIVKQMEVYDPVAKTWSTLPASATFPNGPDVYPMLFQLESGKVFDAGPSGNGELFDPVANTWTFVAASSYGSRLHGSGVLLPDLATVLVAGGTNNPSGGGGPATATAESIMPDKAGAFWHTTGPMNYARYNANALILPDATVLIVGGNQTSKYTLPVEFPELYNSGNQTWTAMAPQVGLRGYHSTALLLPDGRVLSAGSDSESDKTPPGINGFLEATYEYFSPPYLFQGARPTITSAPSSAHYNQVFTVVTPDAASIQKVALIRPGSATHAVLFDQRLVNLKFTVGNGQITVTSPTNANIAPPGYYMLDLLNSNGVPAVMPFIQLQSKTSD